MAWVRLHDGAMSHPKVVGLSDGAFRLWIGGLSYCQMHLTDGQIPRAALHFLGAKVKPAAAVELVRAGLWTETDDGWRVHDFLAWNDDRATIERKRSANTARVSRWRESHQSPPAAASAVEEPESCNALQERYSQSVTNASPSRARSGVGRSGVLSVGGEEREKGGAPLITPGAHRAHASCGRVCVPAFLHEQFRSQLGGDVDAADGRLRAWYRTVLDAIAPDQPVGDEPPVFWRRHFAAAFPSGAPKPMSKGDQRVVSTIGLIERFAARGGTE